MPRQELFVIVRRFCQRQGFEQGNQIAIGIHPIGLAGLDQRINIRTGVGAGDGIGEEPIASPDDKGSNRVLAEVVVDRPDAVLDIPDQLRPLRLQIMQCLAQQTSRRHAVPVRHQQMLNFRQDGAARCLA